MCLVLVTREESVDGVISAFTGFAEGEVEGRCGEDLGVEEVLVVLSQYKAGPKVYQLAE